MGDWRSQVREGMLHDQDVREELALSRRRLRSSRSNLRGVSAVCVLHMFDCSEIPPHSDGNPTFTPLDADA